MDTRIYFIVADSSDINLDLFVEARIASEALTIWAQWCKDQFDITENVNPRVFTVPELTGTPCIFDWEQPDAH